LSDPAEVIDRALTLLVTHLEKQKAAAATHPRLSAGREPHGRTIPAAVRRAVWRRDKGQCAFVGAQGRCTATAFLELHHVLPFAHGGPATEDNIELRCRSHNQYEARRDFPHVLRERSPIYDGASRSENAWLMELQHLVSTAT
jgi:5-methylcytosine-specific restriction endonuclease McrA